MAATLLMESSDNFMDNGWSRMLVLSLFFHLSVFAVIMFVPGALPSGTTRGIVYEVNLVEMPASGGSADQKGTSTTVEGKGMTIPEPKKDSPAKRIAVPTPKKEEKPLIVAKRTVTKESNPVKKPEPKVSSSQLIDRAISNIEKKVKSKEGDHVDKAISALEKKAGSDGAFGAGPSAGAGGSLTGLPIRLYQMEVEYWIKSKWSYPVSVESGKKLEATVILDVKDDGSILDTRLTKKSGDSIFDQSVLKAIERSNPLPPFPEVIRKSHEEFEINFNLSEL
ncbi:MAG: TonB family protein, partial [Deltaproteobacteria bacterium]|nr:TonB family protein [Deltaproteobacteria bacterium]